MASYTIKINGVPQPDVPQDREGAILQAREYDRMDVGHVHLFEGSTCIYDNNAEEAE